MRRELDIFIGTRGTHVSQLLALEWVHHQIIIARMNADDTAFVNFGIGTNEQLATFLQVPQRETQRLAFAVRDHHAILPLTIITRFYRTIVIEHAVD